MAMAILSKHIKPNMWNSSPGKHYRHTKISCPSFDLKRPPGLPTEELHPQGSLWLDWRCLLTIQQHLETLRHGWCCMNPVVIYQNCWNKTCITKLFRHIKWRFYVFFFRLFNGDAKGNTISAQMLRRIGCLEKSMNKPMYKPIEYIYICFTYIFFYISIYSISFLSDDSLTRRHHPTVSQGLFTINKYLFIWLWQKKESTKRVTIDNCFFEHNIRGNITLGKGTCMYMYIFLHILLHIIICTSQIVNKRNWGFWHIFDYDTNTMDGHW